MKHYQYEIGEVIINEVPTNVLVAIHSSNQPFQERQITLEQIKRIRLGKTTELDLQGE